MEDFFAHVILKAALFTTDEWDNVLLVRKKGQSCYVLPGGKLEQYEEPKQALIRELNEEIGVSPASLWPLDYLGMYESGAMVERDTRLISFVYVKKNLKGDIGPKGNIAEIKYMPLPLHDNPAVGSVAKMVAASLFPDLSNYG